MTYVIGGHTTHCVNDRGEIDAGPTGIYPRGSECLGSWLAPVWEVFPPESRLERLMPGRIPSSTRCPGCHKMIAVVKR